MNHPGVAQSSFFVQNHQMPKELIHLQSFNSQEVSKAVKNSLKERFASSSDYNPEEVKTVSESKHSFFPEGFEIEREFSDEIRALCSASQFQKRKIKISSHRKYIGPVIVFVKKIIWKFLDSQLSSKFKEIEKFNTLSTIAQIKSEIKFQELKNKKA